MNVPVHDVYESMVMAVARVGRDDPGVDRALGDAIHHVAQAIACIEAREPEPRLTRFAVEAAYTRVIAVGHGVLAARDGRIAGAEVALRAVVAVLDELAPHVGMTPGDHGLRSAPGIPSGYRISASARRM